MALAKHVCNFLIRLAQKADIPIREQSMRRDDLYKMDEVFLTGTTSEVLPVVKIDGKSIGAGRPDSKSSAGCGWGTFRLAGSDEEKTIRKKFRM